DVPAFGGVEHGEIQLAREGHRMPAGGLRFLRAVRHGDPMRCEQALRQGTAIRLDIRDANEGREVEAHTYIPGELVGVKVCPGNAWFKMSSSYPSCRSIVSSFAVADCTTNSNGP